MKSESDWHYYMNPYEQHRQNQFHAGCCNLMQTQCPTCLQWPAQCKCAGEATITTSGISETFTVEWPSEPCVLTSESSARAIVAAIDDNRPHRAAHLIKELPWFAEILSGVRATRHLKPADYIALSERPAQMARPVEARCDEPMKRNGTWKR